jgi:serine protease Do
MARYVMDRLIASGKVTRGYLGISIQPLSPDLAKEFNLPDESSGVLVGGVSPNSAAAKAGLQDGDVIVELNGKKITDPRNLKLQIAQTAPGTKVNIRVIRSEAGAKPAQKNFTAILAELPQDAFAAMGGRNAPDEQNGKQNMDVLDGVEVTDIDAAARREANIPRAVRGALVTNVNPDSNAAEAGLRPGDIIVEINRQPVHSADEAVALSEKVKVDRVLLRVWSGGGGGPGGTRYIVVENPAK